MDVRLPDGTVIQGVPDGMSRADLTAKLASNGYDVSKLGGESTPQERPAGIGRANPREAMAKLPVADITAGFMGGAHSYLPKGMTQDYENAAKDVMGANPESGAYKFGKLGGQVALTAGVGPALGAAAKAVPWISAPLADAITTGGMTGGNMLTRMAGGAITGGATDLATGGNGVAGAGLGAAAPPLFKGAGIVGEKLGALFAGAAQSPEVVQAIKTARDAGYVIPPTQANPSLGNRLLEGYAGKLTTAQNASARNAEVTNSLAAKAIGLPADAKISPETLASVRKTAGQAYDEIANTGIIKPGQEYTAALDKIAEKHVLAAKGFPGAKPSPVIDLVESLKSPAFDASSAVAKIKELRTAADDAFRTGNTDVARASKQAATALEDALESHLQSIGNPEALQKFRDARELIAKTYSVEKAMNPTTGTVDARKLGAQIEKGKPLTAELRTAGEFANRFKKAAQTPEQMGSLPGNSPLDWGAGGVASVMHGNVLPLVAAVAGRPLARTAALSDLVQNRLVQSPANNKLMELLQTPEAQQLMYRLAPQGANVAR